MQSPVDQYFLSDLVLQCLNYAPYQPESDLKFVKNVRSLRLAVNIFRCDYYSYFFRLISKIPRPKWMDEKYLIEQISCINLSDKNEEFLLTCSVVVQYAHFVFMESSCLHSFFIAVDCLSDIYQHKYLETFGGICRWREFERFCDMTVERKRSSFQAYVESNAEDGELPHYTSSKSDIFNFWHLNEMVALMKAAEREKSQEKNLGFDVKEIASSDSRYMYDLNQRLDEDQLEIYTIFSKDLEAVILQEIKKKPGKFCLGDVLSQSYPVVRDNENPEIKASQEESIETPEMENDTKIPHENEIVLSQSYPVVRDNENPKLKGSQEESKKIPEIESLTKIHENENPDTADISSGEICVSTLIEEHRGSKDFGRKKEISEVKPGISRTDGDNCSFMIQRTEKTSQIVNSSPVVDDEQNFRKTDRSKSESPRSEEESNFILKIIINILRCGINALKYILLRFTTFKNIFGSIMIVFRFIMDTFGRFFGLKKHGETGNAPRLDPAPDDPELECAFAENSSPTEPKSTGSAILRVEAESSEKTLPVKSDLSENSSPAKPKSTVNINPCAEAESSELPVKSDLSENSPPAKPKSIVNINPCAEAESSELPVKSDLSENSPPAKPKSTVNINPCGEAESSEKTLPVQSDLSENSSPAKPKSSVNINPCGEAESSENALPVESIPDETLPLGECESIKGELHQQNESSGKIPLSLTEYIDPMDEDGLVFSEIALHQVQKSLEWTHGTIIFKKLKLKDLEVLNSIKCYLCKGFCWNTLKGETMEYKINFEGHF